MDNFEKVNTLYLVGVGLTRRKGTQSVEDRLNNQSSEVLNFAEA